MAFLWLSYGFPRLPSFFFLYGDFPSIASVEVRCPPGDFILPQERREEQRERSKKLVSWRGMAGGLVTTTL